MSLADLRIEVLTRDRECVAFTVDRSHICRDRWGQEHAPDDLVSLTLGHVRKDPGGARRDEPGWCVALCFAANDRHWESANAHIIRAYLAGVRAATRAAA